MGDDSPMTSDRASAKKPEAVVIGSATLYLGDCLDVLPHLPKVDAVITDPPYGMAWNTDSKRFTGGRRALGSGDGRDDWGAIHEDAQPFDPSPWLKFDKALMWGANHYGARLPVGTTLVWLKKDDHLFGTFLSDAEIGWQKGGYGVYAFRKQFPPPSRMAENDGLHPAHPTQKPIALMAWCIERLGRPATILDPYMGSGTTGVAAMRAGLAFIGIEREPKYFEIACRRIDQAQRQPNLFQPEELGQMEQEALL
jgi:site-specific DNA-methyltransferase (adenine-specific)